jgi:Bacterial Ig domain
MNYIAIRMIAVCTLVFALNSTVMAQNGLERLIVERYYVAGPADTIQADSNGYLPLGAVTYRIFVDMAPVYRFQACYGVEGHELLMKTSTRFYNCPESDGILANDIHPSTLKIKTGMLDSWLSVGAAALDYQGLLKSEDDSSKSLVWENQQGLLRNADPSAGIPISERDGMRFLRLQPAVNSFHMEQDLHLFDYAHRNDVTGTVRTTDGAWASFGGTVGPQPDNRVLIAQLTTDGLLELELNLQLAVPGGGTEKFVARDPQVGEFLHQDLRFSSHPGKRAPQASLSAVRTDKRRINLKADASDPDGTVSRVEFYANDKLVFSDMQEPFSFDLNAAKSEGAPGRYFIKVFDSDGIPTQSATISVE